MTTRRTGSRWPVAARARLALRRATHRGDLGLSVPESLTAIGLITVTLTALLVVTLGAFTAQRRADVLDRAIQVASDRITQLRDVPWDALGFYTGDPGVTATYGGEATVLLAGGSPRPLTGSPAPYPVNDGPSALGSPTPGQIVIDGRPYIIRTAITVATNTTAAYPLKRITVEVTDVSAGRTTTNSTLRAPTAAEAIPATVAATHRALGPCDSASSPLCNAWVTSGQVLQITANGFQPAQPITLQATTIGAATAVTATIPSPQGPLAVVMTPRSADRTTWQATLPTPAASAASPVLHLGAQTITFTVAGDSDSLIYTRASWYATTTTPASITPAAGASTWTNGSLLVDADRADTDRGAPTGNETRAPAFCLTDQGRLADYQALLFDVTNLDSQHTGATTPTITYTALDASGNAYPATIDPTAIAHPTAAAPGYTPATGTVGTYRDGPGALNTTRWSVTFPRGFGFADAGTSPSVTLTISTQRPLDGATVQRTVTVPVSVGCNLTTPALTVATTAAGDSRATWTASPGAGTYQLQTADDASGPWTTIYDGSARLVVLAPGQYPTQPGQVTYYRVRAVMPGGEAGGYSAWSTVQSLTAR